jgi:hypothetical protein
LFFVSALHQVPRLGIAESTYGVTPHYQRSNVRHVAAVTQNHSSRAAAGSPAWESRFTLSRRGTRHAVAGMRGIAPAALAIYNPMASGVPDVAALSAR